MYCIHCGHELEHEPAAAEAEAEAAEKISSDEVQIEQIRANKEVAIAKIQARVTEHVEEVEQAAELAHAEGKAEGLETAIAPEPAPEPEPVVVVNDDPEPEPSIPPAEPEHHEERKAPKKTGFF
jgi:hypothetical protein